MDDDLLRFDKEKCFVFIDCETLNLSLNFCNNLPWQIGMIKVRGDKILDKKDFYIKWETDLKISVDAARITRYDPLRMESRGLSPEEVFPTMKSWLDESDYIVGHNILGFDIYLIYEMYKKFKASHSHLVDKVIDTYCLAKGMKFSFSFNKKSNTLLEHQYKMLHTIKKGTKLKLKDLGKEFEIDHNYDNLHDAICDLELNLKVWNKLKWMIDI